MNETKRRLIGTMLVVSTVMWVTATATAQSAAESAATNIRGRLVIDAPDTATKRVGITYGATDDGRTKTKSASASTSRLKLGANRGCRSGVKREPTTSWPARGQAAFSACWS